MGLDIQNAKFLCLCKRLGVDFSKTLTFGHQEVVIGNRSSIFTQASVEKKPGIYQDKYANSFLTFLGASKIDVADASAYEGANIILDLNKPHPEWMAASYTCVIDLGTLEHVFHYTRALHTAMCCVAKGGHLIIATPANNFMGHGFYQISPELYLQSFTSDNGFELHKMILADQFEESPWYEVDLTHRPTELASRFVPPTSWAPTYLMVLAKRTAIKPIFSESPMQMSYESLWKKNTKNHQYSSGLANQLNFSIRNQIRGFIKKTSLLTFYRQLRSVLCRSKLPNYYRIIPNKDWMTY